MDYSHVFANKDIWIYGYSNLGRNAYNRVKQIYPNQVKGIVVTKHNGRSKKVKNVMDVEHAQIGENSIVLVTANPKFHHDMVENLKDRKSRCYIYTEEMDNWFIENVLEVPLLEIKLLALSVGQACNLKCRDCANFTSYAKKENRRYSIEFIKKNLNIVMPCFKQNDTMHIQGGEPFVYSDLNELLTFLAEKYKDKIFKLQIATNGTILPDEKTLDILSKNKEWYEIRISNYLCNENAGRLCSVLDERGIRYRKYDFVGKKGEWSFCGDIEYVAPIEENTTEKYLSCSWAACYTIENGLLGRCARSIPAKTLQNIQVDEEDYVELNSSCTIEKLGKYIMFMKPMESCKYCKGSRGEAILAAIQI